MRTIKSHTDLAQSKKLVEILPLESADMYYAGHQSIINPKEWEYRDTPNIRGKYISFDDKRIFYPCWSLAALLDVLPNYTDYDTIRNPSLIKNLDNNYMVIYSALKYSGIYDNPVDACYDMIIKLHELNLL